MGDIPKGGGSHKWLNVRNGAMSRKAGENQYDEIGGYDGRITGIRIHDGEYKQRPTKELHVQVTDPNTGEEVIISSTLVGPEGSIGTWAAMFISRLANPENKLEADTHLDIGAYQYSEMNCCSLRLHKQDRPLQGLSSRLPKDRLIAAVTYLQERYGGIESRKQEEERPSDIPPPPPEPEYDNSHKTPDDDLPF